MITPDPITQPERLASLYSTALLDSPPEIEFDRLTGLISRVLHVPVCLVSLLDDQRQFFKSAVGLRPPWSCTRETPLSHSLCRHAVQSRQVFKVEDAPADPRVAENGAVSDLGVVAYMGFPLMGSDGHVWGALCVTDDKPRRWTVDEEATLQLFAAVVADLIDARRSAVQFQQLTEMLAHDLKNPLAGIRLASELLHEKRESVPEPGRRLIEGVREDSASALSLVSSIMERGARAQLDHSLYRNATEVDLASQFDRVAERFKVPLSLKAMRLVSEIEPQNAVLHIDPWALDRIVENLVSNAVKFSPEGTEIRLIARMTEEVTILEVHDQGPGFSEIDRKNLYVRYARLSARPTGDEDSTGLGLSLVKLLVDQCNGEISCISRAEGGTMFRLSFMHT